MLTVHLYDDASFVVYHSDVLNAYNAANVLLAGREHHDAVDHIHNVLGAWLDNERRRNDLDPAAARLYGTLHSVINGGTDYDHATIGAAVDRYNAVRHGAVRCDSHNRGIQCTHDAGHSGRHAGPHPYGNFTWG
jgi:hypothetical protein